MEVGVKVCVEDLTTGNVRHTSSAYLTFVALDDEGKPVPVPPVILESAEEQRRWGEAGKRRQARLRQKDWAISKETDLKLKREEALVSGWRKPQLLPCTCI